MANRTRLAIFEKGFAEELDNMFQRSGLLNPNDEGGVIVLVTRLYVNEVTMSMSETARAEVGLSFFKKSATTLAVF